jgi:hypothetical protein
MVSLIETDLRLPRENQNRGNDDSNHKNDYTPIAEPNQELGEIIHRPSTLAALQQSTTQHTSKL